MIERKQEQLQFLGDYDVIVIGGGISAVAAARISAKKGLKVALTEPTGVLGREITRAYNSFVQLPDYFGLSSSLDEFYECLHRRKGWFDGQIDPVAASVAFDDLLFRHKVDVFFHVWPSCLHMKGSTAAGLEAACKSGRALLTAPTVIDASNHGKIAGGSFRSRDSGRQLSMVHFMYKAVFEQQPDDILLDLPLDRELRVQFKRTFWENEWRVTLSGDRRRTRADWLLLLDQALPLLRRQFPALQTGVLAHLADDAWGEPEQYISTGSSDNRVAGYVSAPPSHEESSDQTKKVPITVGMLCNPSVVEGLFLAGPWLEGFPFDPRAEDVSIVNGFLLGELAAFAALHET